VKIQGEVFWVVTPRSVVVQCERFRGPWRQRGPPKRWYPTTTPYVDKTQKTSKLHRRESIVNEYNSEISAMFTRLSRFL